MRIGIDLGGTKIEVVALDNEGREHFRKRIFTPQGDYEKILDSLGALVEECESHLGLQGKCSVGIGTPGSVLPDTGILQNSNSVCLIGKPFQKDIESKLKRQVKIANDANCLALSEAKDGAAVGCQVVFAVILGTGVGGGIVVNNTVISGANGIAGEWGHNPLPWPTNDELPGPKCYCGKYGCIETFLSGPGLSADYFRKNNKQLDAKVIAENAGRGNKSAQDTLVRFEDRLARALANVINILDPQVIVFGGGLSKIDQRYTNIPKILPKYVFSQVVRTKLVAAKHGDSSGVRGAAMLWVAP